MVNIILDFSKKDNVEIKFSETVPAKSIKKADIPYASDNTHLETITSVLRDLRGLYLEENTIVSANFPAIYEGIVETIKGTPEEIIEELERKSINTEGKMLVQHKGFMTDKKTIVTPVGLVDSNYSEIVDLFSVDQCTTNIIKLADIAKKNNIKGHITIVYNYEETNTEVLFMDENNLPIAFTKTILNKGIPGIADVLNSPSSNRIPLDRKKAKSLSHDMKESFLVTHIPNKQIDTPTVPQEYEQQQPYQQQYQQQYQQPSIHTPQPTYQYGTVDNPQPLVGNHNYNNIMQGGQPQYQPQYQNQPQQQYPPQYQDQPQYQPQQQYQRPNQTQQQPQEPYQTQQRQQPQDPYQVPYEGEGLQQDINEDDNFIPFVDEDSYAEDLKEYDIVGTTKKKGKKKGKKKKAKKVKDRDTDKVALDTSSETRKGKLLSNPKLLTLVITLILVITVTVSILGKMVIDMGRKSVSKPAITFEEEEDSGVPLVTYVSSAMTSLGVRASKVDNSIEDGVEILVVEIDSINDDYLIALQTRLEVRCELEIENLEPTENTAEGSDRIRITIRYS